MRKTRTKKKAAPIAFFSAIFFMLVVIGFLYADYNTSKMGYGESSMRIDIYTDDGLVFLNVRGETNQWTISEHAEQFFRRFMHMIPIKARMVYVLIQTVSNMILPP